MLLAALEPGRYTGAGAYEPENAPTSGYPLEWSATLSRGEDRLEFEGIYRHHVGASEHPFRLDLFLPSQILKRGHFDLQSPHLHLVRGVFRVVGGGIVFAGYSDAKAVSVTLNIEVLAPNTLDGKGVLFHPTTPPWFFWFSISQVPTHASKANVVDLHSRRL
jgi:hypothetical protein